jgi:hypothetical protein
MTHAPVLLLLDALACYRLTRLVVTDYLTEPLRERLRGRVPLSDRQLTGDRIVVAKRPKVAEFLSCPWCVSFWTAIGVVLMQSLLPTACLYVTAVLAFSAVAGIIAESR